MITDLSLAMACARVYLPGVTIEAGADLAVNVKDWGGPIVVSFRGTANVKGWLRDIDALPKSHDLLGYCHAGFLAGATQVWQKLSLPEGRDIILTGHSLGGALAIIVAALRIAAGERVDRLVTFGAPRAGYSRLVEILAGVDVRQYRRGDDPVPLVPFDLIAFPYKHVREPLISIGRAQIGFSDHDIEGYIADLELPA